MKALTSNIGLKKGNVITYAEQSKISHGAGTPNHHFEDVTFDHAFVITRVNPKTYTCRYTEGPYAGSGFKWHMTDAIATNLYYLREGTA